tara:strand:+ start:3622 stop:4110 length:489 start_codon:yes stop_codon:yes gene_type:complete
MADNKTTTEFARDRSNEFYKTILRKDEAFRGEAYQLPGETEWTIGYGHYGADVEEGDTITKKEAEDLLDQDVRERITSVNEMIEDFDSLPENLRGSLFSEHYRGSIAQSPKTRKLINEGRFLEAADEFLDNDQYRNAVEEGIPGIRPRMERLAEALRKHAKK